MSAQADRLDRPAVIPIARESRESAPERLKADVFEPDESESHVLGCVLFNPDDRASIADLEPAELSDPVLRVILQAIDATPGGDILNVLLKLREWGQDVACGGLPYLNSLAAAVPARTALRRHADLIKNKAADRRRSALRQQAAELLRSDAPPSEVRPLLDCIEGIETAAEHPRFSLLSAADLHSLPPATWRIHSVLPAVGVAALFGPSASGKSFIAVDLVAAIGRGGLWFGRRVSPGRCVYVALEGQTGMRHRVKAHEVHHGATFPESVHFMFGAFRLTEGDDVHGLAKSIEAAGGADVVVIDTLNRAAPEADENSSADMGRILEGVRALQAQTGGLVLLVHHAGKDIARGLRGHSSMFAAMDAVISVNRDGDRREWSLSKSKDGEDGQTHTFRLELVCLSTDDDEEPITSCVVEATQALDEAPRVRQPRGGNQKIVYDALGPLFRESHDKGKAGAPFGRPCLELEAAVDQVRERLPVEPKRRAERAQLAIRSLVASGVLDSNEGWIWLR